MRKLLYVDSSYSLSQVRSRGLGHVLRMRFLDGYFDRVWSAHPVDTHPALDPDIGPSGKPFCERISDDHVFVRGRYGRFPLLAHVAPLNALLGLGSFVAGLVRLVRREKIKVIRAGDPLMCGLIGLIVSRMTGARLVVRINGDHDMIRASSGSAIMPSLFRFVAIEKLIERLVLTRAHCIVAPSRNYGDFAVRKGADRDRVVIVRYGNLIDPIHFEEPEARGLPVDEALTEELRARPWMVHVGRLHSMKHATDCYDVLLKLARDDHVTGLLLIGDGPLREEMTRRAEADGLSERVRFLGNIDQRLIAQVLPLCTIALSPLTGRALAEVALAALPIIAYDLDWQGEVVETDVTGVLVPARNTVDMSRAAAWLLADASLRRTLGAEARRRAYELLEPEEQTRREIEAYRNLGVLE